MNYNSDKIKIFISSSMKSEGKFNWKNTRKQLKIFLQDKMPNVEVFLIEEHPQIEKSNELMEIQIEKSDIIIMILKGNIRKGTRIEFDLLKKHEKGLLLFFLKTPRKTKALKEFKKEIENIDYCSYGNEINENDMNDIIYNSLLANITNIYQKNQKEYANYYSKVYELANENDRIIGKENISYFDSVIDYAISELEISRINYVKNSAKKSKLHTFGIKSINWLLKGEFCINKNDLNNLMKCTKNMYKDNKFLRYRWNAIIEKIEGNINEALSFEEKALKEAKNKKLAKWIIDDILIDCRNLELNKLNIPNSRVDFKYQKELENNTNILYLPVSDRYLSNLLEETLNQEYKQKTASSSSIIVGSNITSAIVNLLNYYFSSLLYGSITHMERTREILIKILYKYSEYFENNNEILIKCFELYILNGNTKQIDTFTNKEWENIAPYIINNPINIWNLAHKSNSLFKKKNIINLFKYIGQYLNNKEYKIYFNEIKNIVYDLNSQDTETISKCLITNSRRISTNQLANISTKLLNSKKFLDIRKIIDILMYINYDDISEPCLKKIIHSINNNYKDLKNETRIYALIRIIINRDKKYETYFDQYLKNINGMNEIVYNLNSKSIKYKDNLVKLIEYAREQHKHNCNSPGIISFGYNPFANISDIICKNYNKFYDAIINELFEFGLEVYYEKDSLEFKCNCFKCLCNVLSFCLKNNIKTVDKYRNRILYLNISVIKETHELSIASTRVVKFYILMLKQMYKDSEKEFIEWCRKFSKYDEKDKIELSNSLANYYMSKSQYKQISFVLLDLCINDKSFLVRKNALNCIVNIVNNQPDNTEYINKLYEYVYDLTLNIKGYLIDMCNEKIIIDKKIRKKILLSLANDSSYVIRDKAKKELVKYNKR